MATRGSGPISRAEREEYARKVRSLRQAHGMTQAQLADASGVTRATIVNIETGNTVPQLDVLSRVLGPLGVDLRPSRFSPQTEFWLTMLGTLIEAVPAERRQATVDLAIRMLAESIRTDVSAEGDDSWHVRAASTDATQPDPGEHTP